MRICDRRRREGVYIQINSHKKSDGQIRSEIEKGRATRKGMDEGKGGKTRSMQERERVRTGGNHRIWKEKKKRDQPGHGDSGQEDHEKGRG